MSFLKSFEEFLASNISLLPKHVNKDQAGAVLGWGILNSLLDKKAKLLLAEFSLKPPSSEEEWKTVKELFEKYTAKVMAFYNKSIKHFYSFMTESVHPLIEFAYPFLYKVKDNPSWCIYEDSGISDSNAPNWNFLLWLFGSDPTLGVVDEPGALKDKVSPYLFELCFLATEGANKPASYDQKRTQRLIIHVVLQRIREAINEADSKEEGVSILKGNLHYMGEGEPAPTALMLAAEYNRLDLVQELLAFDGIDVNQASWNSKETTALSLAEKNGNQEIVQLLKSHGARLDQNPVNDGPLPSSAKPISLSSKLKTQESAAAGLPITMTKDDLNKVIGKYKKYKDRSCCGLGLAWFFSSAESESCYNHLKNASDDIERFRIAKNYITHNPQKRFALCLREVLDPKVPIINGVGLTR